MEAPVRKRRRRRPVPALAYVRTSSAANVGLDKHSDTRQREAIQAFAEAAGYEVVGEHYDAAVSGADPVSERPGFAEMLDRIEGNGVRTIIVEDASRFARDLAVQLAGHDMLRARGIDLVAANAPDHFTEDTPTAKLVRQVLGAIAEFEKAQLVARLRVARERKRQEHGRCGGRQSLADLHPEAAALARKLRRKRRGHKGLSYAKVAERLADAGHTIGGQPFTLFQVRRLLAARQTRT